MGYFTYIKFHRFSFSHILRKESLTKEVRTTNLCVFYHHFICTVSFIRVTILLSFINLFVTSTWKTTREAATSNTCNTFHFLALFSLPRPLFNSCGRKSLRITREIDILLPPLVSRRQKIVETWRKKTFYLLSVNLRRPVSGYRYVSHLFLSCFSSPLPNLLLFPSTLPSFSPLFLFDFS